MTTRCAVAGHPVGHSLSPAIHRAAYEFLGLSGWEYGFADLSTEEFAGFVGSRDSSWRGLSVTMPHKDAAAELGEPDADVAITGVANTLVWHRGGRTSHNTDIGGFVAALRTRGIPDLDRAVIIGSGATARSAAVALVRLKVTQIVVLARRAQAAAALSDFAQSLGVRASVADWGQGVPMDATLVVSTVPAAGADAVADVLATRGAGALWGVFDVSYDPWPSRLGSAASSLGLTVVNGLDLLAHQAVGQIRLMTGQEVPAEPLLSAAREELERRASA